MRLITRFLIWPIIVVGIVVGGLRLGLANISLFKTTIEDWVAAEVIPGLAFDEIKSHWSHYGPVFQLDRAAITLPDRSRPIVVDRVEIGLDLWGGLIFGTSVVREVIASVEKITIRKDAQSRWWLNNINLASDQDSASVSDVESLIEAIPHYLQIELTRFIIEDEAAQQRYQFDNIDANIEHHYPATHMQLSANLPNEFGNTITVKSIVEGGSGTLYVQSNGLHIDPIAALLGLSMGNIAQVDADSEVWVNVKSHQIDTVNANIDITHANYGVPEAEVASPFKLSLQLSAVSDQGEWRLTQKLDELSFGGQALPPINSQFNLSSNDEVLNIDGWIEDLALDHWSDLVGLHLPKKLADTVKKAHIHGSVQDVYFSLQSDDLSGLQVSAFAADLSSKNVQSIPGIDQVSANIVYGKQRAEIDLTAKKLELDFGSAFRAPLMIDQFEAKLRLDLNDQSAVLSIPEIKAVNSDIHLAGRLRLEVDPKTKNPFMYLRAHFDDGVGSQKSKYLPVKLLPKAALKWLDDGIRAVDVSNGELMFHGRLDNIVELDKKMSGEFYAGFDVDNAEISFDPSWKSAKGGSGHVLFHNLGMDIKLDSVDYDGIKHGQGHVKIPNFAKTVVQVDLNTEASTGKALQVWLDTPVGEDYRAVIKNLHDPKGRINTNIHLSLPVGDPTLTEDINIKLDIDNAAIKSSAWGLQFDKIEGVVNITQSAISAKGITAKYFQDDVSIDIDTDQAEHLTLIKTNSLIDTTQMLNLLPQSITHGLDGKSQWQIGLAIANRANSHQPILTINAASDLQGTRVQLPQQLGKVREQARATKATVNLGRNGDIDFMVSYGADIKTRGRLTRANNEGYQLQDLDVGLATPLKAEQQGGIRLYGRLASVQLDEWVDYYQVVRAMQQPESRSLLPLLQAVDLNVAEVTLGGRQTKGLDLFLAQSVSGLAGVFKSSVIKGTFDFPFEYSSKKPVVVELDYARLSRKLGESQGLGLLPSQLYNLHLTSKEFVYDHRLVTDVVLDTRIDDNVLLIDSLVFKRDKVTFKTDGSWSYSPDTQQHSTQLSVSIKGDEFGQTLAKLDFGDIIHNGSINFKGQINWPDDLFNVRWALLNGSGSVKLKDGILKNVEPGSGRFVGLLSLSAIPRRLAFDFSDVLFDGMEFDEIKGDFVLDGQSLYTNNTKMDGPAAEIKVVGTTGMRDRDYNQKITVIPKIRNTLPVIGTIAAGTGVGWGLLLLQNLFKSAIDESVELKYSMTGSWDSPIVEPIEPPPSAVKKQPNFREGFEK